jgi:hypothetical protein
MNAIEALSAGVLVATDCGHFQSRSNEKSAFQYNSPGQRIRRFAHNSFYRQLLHRLRIVVFFFFHAIAAQQVGQALRKGGTRHHRVATGLRRFHLQVALQV